MNDSPRTSVPRLNGPPYAYRWICDICGTRISTAEESPRAANRVARRRHTSARCARALREQGRQAQGAVKPTESLKAPEPPSPPDPPEQSEPPEAGAQAVAADEQHTEGQLGLFD